MQKAVGCLQKAVGESRLANGKIWQEETVGGKNYQDLIVWQKAMNLVQLIYDATKSFPKEETYGLTSQIRRAAVSIPSNIAEGQGRASAAEFRRFRSIAHGSVREVETQIMISQRLAYLRADATQRILEQSGEVGRLINGLSSSLSAR
jgi:four helix bundle protein